MSPLLFLPLFFIQTYSFSPCPGDFKCGGFNISYPFSRYDESTTMHCGFPGLLISCENDTPILRLDYVSYTVLNISYDTYTVNLVSTDVLEQNTSCPIVHNDVTLIPESGVTYTSDVANLTFFLDCNISSGVVNATPITCLSGAQNGNSYVFLVDESLGSSPYAYLMAYCPTIVEVPVLGYWSQDDLNAEFGTLITRGFQLGWNSANDCIECLRNSGQCGYTMNGKLSYLFNCFCPNGSCDAKKRRHILPMILLPIGCFFGLLAIAFCILLFARKNRKNGFGMKGRKMKNFLKANLENFGSLALKMYTFSEIKKITRSFNQKIGQGGYASVFKGELMDGTPVAVKVFKDSESSGAEFTSEVVLIAKTSHVNIVRILGFSIEGSRRALIYEFMPNGSLDKYLRESQNSTLSDLVCKRLFEIVVGIARWLEYLHRGCNTRIVHFDIKPHNILLDQDYCPKISDFGLAKFCQSKESIVSMSGMRGTYGYIAPEVYSRNFGAVSSKSDVYSYGMMMLEMFGGRQGQTEFTNSCSDTYFPNYIYKCVEQNNISCVFDVPVSCEEIVRKITIIGLWCIQMVPQARPTMNAVLDMFERNTDELALPPPLNVSPPKELVLETTDLTVSSISYDQQ